MKGALHPRHPCRSFAYRHLAGEILHTVAWAIGKSLGGPSFLRVIFGSFERLTRGISVRNKGMDLMNGLHSCRK